jgi:Uma2 family endonuclease
MSRTATAKKLMTAEEFYDWANSPENEARDYELVRGRVVEVSRPGDRHGVVCVNTVVLLDGYMRRRRRGRVVSNDAGVILERDPDTVRGPDVVYHDKTLRYEDLNPKFSEDVPILGVEVLSPNDRIGAMTKRVAEFLKAGMKMVWVLDPDARDLTIYRADQPPVVLDETQEVVVEDVLPGFRCRVADFFFVCEEESEASKPTPPSSKSKKRRSN